MNTLEFTDYKTIINTIHQWPISNRLALVQDILKTLTVDLASVHASKNTLSKALGLLETEQPAPSDNEVKQMLVESRLEKYGL